MQTRHKLDHSWPVRPRRRARGAQAGQGEDGGGGWLRAWPRYNLSMTNTAATTPNSPGPAASGPPGFVPAARAVPGSAFDAAHGRPGAGLTEQDATRIAAAIAANHAESTRAVYAHAWSKWEDWCTKRGFLALPAAPSVVSAYLTERAEHGTGICTIDTACSAIANKHRLHDLDNPVVHETVRRVRRGLRRTLGNRPRRRARALTVTEIAQIVTSLDRSTRQGTRDAAIILLGFASAKRRSELAHLTLADIESKPGGVLLTIRGSKTDAQRHGHVVGVAHGQHAHTDPIAALAAWIAFRGTAPGPLFTTMRRGRVGLDPISGDAIARMLRARAEDAGLPAERITGHSLRAGHVTTAAMAGVSLDRIAAQSRHRNIGVLIEHYIRPAHALAATSSRDLGL